MSISLPKMRRCLHNEKRSEAQAEGKGIPRIAQKRKAMAQYATLIISIYLNYSSFCLRSSTSFGSATGFVTFHVSFVLAPQDARLCRKGYNLLIAWGFPDNMTRQLSVLIQGYPCLRGLGHSLFAFSTSLNIPWEGSKDTESAIHIR